MNQGSKADRSLQIVLICTIVFVEISSTRALALSDSKIDLETERESSGKGGSTMKKDIDQSRVSTQYQENNPAQQTTGVLSNRYQQQLQQQQQSQHWIKPMTL